MTGPPASSGLGRAGRRARTRVRVRARRRGSADVDAEVLGDAAQAGGVALPDGAELPVGVAAVELAEDHRGLHGGVLGEIEAGDLAAGDLVDDADEGVADAAEVLSAVVRVRDGHREHGL